MGFGPRYPLARTSSQPEFQIAYQADFPPTPRTFACPVCSHQGEYVSVNLGDSCLRCRNNTGPRPLRFINSSSLGLVSQTTTAIDNESFAIPRPTTHTGAVNVPFQTDTNLPSKSQSPGIRKPYRTPKNPACTNMQHSKKEKQRREKNAGVINSIQLMQSVSPWPGEEAGWALHACIALKDLVEC